MGGILRWLGQWTGGEYRYLAGMFRRLGVSVHAGVDILRALETEARHGGPSHQAALHSVHQHVRSGETLWHAMEAVRNYFPTLAIELVRVGEETGRLEAVLLRLADHYDHLYKVRRNFLSAITWPVMELLIAIGVIALLIWLMGILNTTDILGFGLVGTRGVVIYLLIVGGIAATLALLVHSLAYGWWGTAPVRMAMTVPVIGTALRTAALNRFTWTLGAALETGMEVRRAMQLALRSTQNPVFLDAIDPCDRSLASGQDFAATLRQSRVFPNELVDTVEAAEIAGTLSESLAHLARQYEEQARESAYWVARFIAGAIWVGIALLIIALIFRIAGVYIGAIRDNLPQ
jgi:type IV pilus assembly protein PilC